VNPAASFFRDSDLLLAADCSAFTYGAFHPDLLRGKTLVTGCPKFDDVDLYLEKLTEILRDNQVRSITVAKMRFRAARASCGWRRRRSRPAARTCR